jgi:hypothetical protein
MYLPEDTYDCFVSYVLGYDDALDGAILKGFREWATMLLNKQANYGWPAVALGVLLGDLSKNLVSIEENRAAIAGLHRLVSAFVSERGNDLETLDRWVTIPRCPPMVLFEPRSRRSTGFSLPGQSFSTSGKKNVNVTRGGRDWRSPICGIDLFEGRRFAMHKSPPTLFRIVRAAARFYALFVNTASCAANARLYAGRASARAT